MTAAIFIRGLLSDEHGIDFSKCEWVEGDINSAKPHGNPTILPTAKKLSISANKSGKSLSKMLEDGELQAIIGTGVPEAFGRNPDIVRLYPDYRAAEMDYYKRTKIFPIMHTVVIRRDVHEKHPFVATALYHALDQSKNLALKKMNYRGTLRYMLPWMTAELDEIDAVFGGDPWPYGVEANRPTLERAGALSGRAGRDRQGAEGRRSVRAGAADPSDDALGQRIRHALACLPPTG